MIRNHANGGIQNSGFSESSYNEGIPEVYQTFPAIEARRILRRLEFHYTPRHASWLNMAEIEIGVMRRQCLDRRIDNRDLLETEVKAWERRRTESGAQIRWMFSIEQAREKMAKSYPTPSLKES